MIIKVSSNLGDSVVLATHPGSAHSHWLWGTAEALISLSGSFRRQRRKGELSGLSCPYLGQHCFLLPSFTLSCGSFPGMAPEQSPRVGGCCYQQETGNIPQAALAQAALDNIAVKTAS